MGKAKTVAKITFKTVILAISFFIYAFFIFNQLNCYRLPIQTDFRF